jgi:hypothetical protein
MPENEYLLTEVKNEVELTQTEIYQNEAEQMSNSANWFEKRPGPAGDERARQRRGRACSRPGAAGRPR